MAPPARQTKSAAWALTTKTVFWESILRSKPSVHQRAGIRHRHALDIGGRESAIHESLREHRKALRHRRIDGLAQVCGKNAVFRARLANAYHHLVPGRFTGVHGSEAMLDHCAFPRQFSLLIGGQVLRGELSMRHQDAL